MNSVVEKYSWLLKKIFVVLQEKSREREWVNQFLRCFFMKFAAHKILKYILKKLTRGLEKVKEILRVFSIAIVFIFVETYSFEKQ